MKWHSKLYFGEEAKKKKNKIMTQLDKHTAGLGIYVVMVATNGKDLLDVIPSLMLFRDRYQEQPIVGVAVTKEEAFEVCEAIIMDVYQKTGGFDVRGYFA